MFGGSSSKPCLMTADLAGLARKLRNAIRPVSRQEPVLRGVQEISRSSSRWAMLKELLKNILKDDISLCIVFFLMVFWLVVCCLTVFVGVSCCHISRYVKPVPYQKLLSPPGCCGHWGGNICGPGEHGVVSLVAGHPDIDSGFVLKIFLELFFSTWLL